MAKFKHPYFILYFLVFLSETIFSLPDKYGKTDQQLTPQNENLPNSKNITSEEDIRMTTTPQPSQRPAVTPSKEQIRLNEENMNK